MFWRIVVFNKMLSNGRLTINFRIVVSTYTRWLLSCCITFLPDARGTYCFILSASSCVVRPTYQASPSFRPSTKSTIFVAGNRDLVFCRQRRKRISSIFDTKDRRQRQESFMRFPGHSKFSSPATKIILLSDENRAVC